MSFFEFPHTRTYDNDLGWLIKHVNSYDEAITALNQWKEETEATIDDIYNLYNDIINGNIPPEIMNAIKDWLKLNAVDIIGDLIKIVFFGLTDDGYFVAYIPNSWDSITFATTGLDITIAGYDYGHLVLNY